MGVTRADFSSLITVQRMIAEFAIFLGLLRIADYRSLSPIARAFLRSFAEMKRADGIPGLSSPTCRVEERRSYLHRQSVGIVIVRAPADTLFPREISGIAGLASSSSRDPLEVDETTWKDRACSLPKFRVFSLSTLGEKSDSKMCVNTHT